MAISNSYVKLPEGITLYIWTSTPNCSSAGFHICRCFCMTRVTMESPAYIFSYFFHAPNFFGHIRTHILEIDLKNWLWYVLPVPERNAQIGNAAHTSMWYGVVSFPKVCIYSNPQNRTHLQRINPKKFCGIIILDSLDKSNIGLLPNPTSIWFWANYNNSLTWILRPFGDGFPKINDDFQGSLVVSSL